MTQNKERERPLGWRMNNLAYIREGEILHTGEAVILACLMHARGRGRTSPDMTDVQRIMHDQNLELKKAE